MAVGPGQATKMWIVGLCLVVSTVVFIQNAWVSDDAQITFRSIEQLFAGNGPRWNPHERVQAFTHPLWFLLLVPVRLLTRDLLLGVVVLSFAAASGALVVAGRVVWREGGSESGPLVRWTLGLTAFLSSRALVDYASSGLETALLYLLLAIVYGLCLRPRGLWLWLTVSALLLCRLDLAPLVLPIALAATRRFHTPAREAFVGLVPLGLWTAFSLVYYGFPLPNTAYAKLATGIETRDLVTQGLHYLVHACRWDPITMLMIVAGIVVGFSRSSRLGLGLAIGIGLDLAYVVWVGGDFMAGRFLAPIAWLSLLAVVDSLPRLSRRALLLGAVALTLYNVTAPVPPIRTTPSSGPAWDFHAWWGIADERGHYFSRYGLISYLRNGRTVEVRPVAEQVINPRLVVRYVIGRGWTLPLDRIIVDRQGLADPLLSRLPASPGWRVGHYLPAIPDGYLESIAAGQNLIVDPTLHALYDDLRLATQGDLWTAERWRAIARLNLRSLAIRVHAPRSIGRRRLAGDPAPIRAARRHIIVVLDLPRRHDRLV